MNIFLPYSDFKLNTQCLDDLRLNKMILEHAQLLSTAINLSGGQATYKTTHVNHPCAIFTRKTKCNYAYVLNYYVEMCMEFKYRRNKEHGCARLMTELLYGLNYIPSGELTQFPNCTPYKELEVHEAYRKTLIDKWNNDKRPPKWTNRITPVFYA